MAHFWFTRSCSLKYSFIYHPRILYPFLPDPLPFCRLLSCWSQLRDDDLLCAEIKNEKCQSLQRCHRKIPHAKRSSAVEKIMLTNVSVFDPCQNIYIYINPVLWSYIYFSRRGNFAWTSFLILEYWTSATAIAKA